MPRRYSNPRKESRALGFITSGSVSVETQRKPTHHKLIAAIVMNIISTCLATLGTISLSIFSITYESIADDYDWSHLAGSMLLQFLLFSAITELVITNIVIDWFVTAVTQVPNDEEAVSLRIEEIPCPIDSSAE
uniref:Uncharacterized protein n=1 Tax=Rousettus aegyptiacus TaxID=9407 RepID=A0A7J8H2Q9_ROUAE|nr:hypothetical protein HJG63_011372 [Rousettus aegyptiacus]